MITETKFNLDIEIVNEINEIARKYSEIEKIVLFGSRARKNNLPKSDIDLAVFLSKNNTAYFITNSKSSQDYNLQLDLEE